MTRRTRLVFQFLGALFLVSLLGIVMTSFFPTALKRGGGALIFGGLVSGVSYFFYRKFCRLWNRQVCHCFSLKPEHRMDTWKGKVLIITFMLSIAGIGVASLGVFLSLQ